MRGREKEPEIIIFSFSPLLPRKREEKKATVNFALKQWGFFSLSFNGVKGFFFLSTNPFQ